jgi:hypothetical protein
VAAAEATNYTHLPGVAVVAAQDFQECRLKVLYLQEVTLYLLEVMEQMVAEEAAAELSRPVLLLLIHLTEQLAVAAMLLVAAVALAPALLMSVSR